MMLAVETVQRTISACVTADDGTLLDLRHGGASERDAPAIIDALIRAHGRPEAIAIAHGPGSFTGLRVGVMAVRTCAWLDHVPVIAVDSLIARACQQGPGLWWVLQSLKKDTTHHALVRVQADGRPDVVVPTQASLDAQVIDTALFDGAIAIGSGLQVKPGLAAQWYPAIRLGDASALHAHGVALAARFAPRIAWDALLPAYHQEAAPVLQRRASL